MTAKYFFNRYAAFKGWAFEVLSEDVTDTGGMKVTHTHTHTSIWTIQ